MAGQAAQVVLRAQSVKASLAQRAALPPFSRREWALWLSFAVLVQSLWGLWAVCTRYMQTIPPNPAPTLQLAAMINIIALPSTMAVGYMNSLSSAAWAFAAKWLMQKQQQSGPEDATTETFEDCRVVMAEDICAGHPQGKAIAVLDDCAYCLEQQQGHMHTQQAGPGAELEQYVQQLHGSAPGDAGTRTAAKLLSDAESGQCCTVGTVNNTASSASSGSSRVSERSSSRGTCHHAASAEGKQQHQQQHKHLGDDVTTSDWREKVRGHMRKQAIPAGIGLLAAAYNFSNIYSAKFISAYIVQLVFLFSPILIAIGSSYFFKQKRPPGLFITLFVAIGGSAMVIAGKWMEGHNTDSSERVTGKQAVVNLVIGLVLSVISVLVMTAYMLCLQIFRTSTTSEQLLIANRNISLLFFLPLALGIEGTKWQWLYTLRPADWGVLFFSVIVIYTLDNYWLQICTRRIGASMFSVFVSLRLVASVIGSIVLLQDVPRSPITWAGFAVVIAVMTAFLVYQQLHGRQVPRGTSISITDPLGPAAGGAPAGLAPAATA